MSVFIACGFRCFTKKEMAKKFDVRQPSLPFDSGFFTPEFVEKMIRAKKTKLNLENTYPCIKQEGFECKGERGVYFQTCTYEEINEYITKNGYDNHCLDKTSGYYPYLKDYDCVLVHYNWHPLSKQEVTNPVENLKIIQKTFNRRLKRLLQMIRKGQHLHIFWHTNKREQFLRINNKSYDLNKLHSINILMKVMKNIF